MVASVRYDLDVLVVGAGESPYLQNDIFVFRLAFRAVRKRLADLLYHRILWNISTLPPAATGLQGQAD